MSPWEQRRADVFADALESRATAATSAPATARLVGVARSIRDASLESPDGQFAVVLRERLMAEAPHALSPQRVVHVRPVRDPMATGTPGRQRLAAASAVLAVAGGSFGLVTASAQALPGDALYSVKRGVEQTDLALQRGDGAEGRTNLQHAGERLAEVEAMVEDGTVDSQESALAAEALEDFTSQADAGARELLEAYANGRDASAITEISDFSLASSSSLAGLSKALPQSTGPAYAEAAGMVTELSRASSRICASCRTSGPASPQQELVDRVEDLAATGQPMAAPGPVSDLLGQPDDRQRADDPQRDVPSDSLPDASLPDDSQPDDSQPDDSQSAADPEPDGTTTKSDDEPRSDEPQDDPDDEPRSDEPQDDPDEDPAGETTGVLSPLLDNPLGGGEGDDDDASGGPLGSLLGR